MFGTVTFHVPLPVVKRDGRQELPMPEAGMHLRRADKARVRAPPRASRWKRVPDVGDPATVAAMTGREGIAPLVMHGRRLTPPTSDIVEAIPQGKQRPGVMLTHAMEPYPSEWSPQRTN